MTSLQTDSADAPFEFGTKAETLGRLAPLIVGASIPDFYFFTLERWRNSRQDVLRSIRERFKGNVVAVRSSALIEDGELTSMAGAFLTRLHVSSADEAALMEAIEQVVASMTGNARDQVLIQRMVNDIAVSGVIMTYDMVHGSPYYCIDFDDETGRTDSVTAGDSVNKGLFVYRDARPEMIRSRRVAKFLQLARELESVCGCAALDIEFGLGRNGDLYLFQVRRIALSGQWHPVTERRVARQLKFIEHFVVECSARRDGVLGDRTILAIMPDWNPAELIGTTPRQLAASLYRELITKSVWCKAREAMGYRSLGEVELMMMINNHPYIDVRHSFNSFLPAALPEAIGSKLVNAWLDRLEQNPEFHDKVEFDIVHTCLDFSFAETFRDRYAEVLDGDEFQVYRNALRELTRRCIAPGQDSTLDAALSSAQRLADEALDPIIGGGAHQYLARADYLLTQCRTLGTYSFAIVARHAFIAEALLRTAVDRGALSQERLLAFKRSVRTVTGSMVEEYASVCAGTLDRGIFLRKFGHLRPGTYEVTSLRYDERDDLFLDDAVQVLAPEAPVFALHPDERTGLDALLSAAGLDVFDADALLAYANKAIAGREYVKFTFTRTLSDALSALVVWGELHGLSRDDVSYLDWPTISKSLSHPIMDYVDRYYLDKADAARRSMTVAHAFRLSHIMYGARDVYVATVNRSVPNFVGVGSASGQVVELTTETSASINIAGKIVCIGNADPGFDWIFTKMPAALVTRFGGANSHMAIRCAEFGLPAAIGCGEQIYERIVSAGRVEINCAGKILRPLYGT
ncbi:PEP/pyruvate-binding domain-containing protein [Bordetella bronchialis]|uniref:Pyruvate, phosphate dikinase n=1 Tax=Bordetella bronchialis TaxID=463025 RepID=A0ABN4R796_9BORD|nr:PEP/pyruvate-binding domain-containing protein [Bordetella bronchialis]ANN69077.1 hypothetical protein BAU06_24700 [Bordetella bronchialis]